MKLLITGGAGYLGSILWELALNRLWTKHRVRVVDNFMHRQPSLSHLVHNHNLEIICGDVRNHVSTDMSWPDVIVPLAAIVGAPACERDENAAHTTNFWAVKDLVRRASKDQAIIYPNTNSGYGVGGETECTEDSPLLPVSLYGKTKVNAEAEVLEHPRSTVFRFATLFGFSPRMRLDLMVNDFVYRAAHDKALTLFEPHFRRNFLHVRDAANLILAAAEDYTGETEQKIGGPAPAFSRRRVFNAGLSSANMTKAQLCDRIAEHVPGFTYSTAAVGKDPDQRDYVVSNARLEACGWFPNHTLDNGVAELVRGYAMPLGSPYRNIS